jgi:hypothetical protein
MRMDAKIAKKRRDKLAGSGAPAATKATAPVAQTFSGALASPGEMKAGVQFAELSAKKFSDMPLSDPRVSARQTYMGNSDRINGDLRDGKVPPEAAALDSIFGTDLSAKVPEGVTLWRGGVMPAGGLEVGSVVKDDGYLSTSTNAYVGQAFTKMDGTGVLYKVVDSGGVDTVPGATKEYELLLPRGTELKVVGMQDHPMGFKVAEVAVVPQKPASEAPASAPAAKPKPLRTDYGPEMKPVRDAMQAHLAAHQGAKMIDSVSAWNKSNRSGEAALEAFTTGAFSEINADPNMPVSKKLMSYLDKLPNASPPAMFRGLGFETPEARDAFIATLDGRPQDRTLSSWTAEDASHPSATPMNNIALDLASQFGEEVVVLKYENPKAAKDISYAYGPNVKAGLEFVATKGTRLQAVKTENVNGKTIVTVRDADSAPTPAAKAASVAAAAKPSKAEVRYVGDDKAGLKSEYDSVVGVSPAELIGVTDPDAAVAMSAKSPVPGAPHLKRYHVSAKMDGVDYIRRTIEVDTKTGRKTITNADLYTSKPGVGRALLAQQVAHASNAGFKSISTEAAGHGPKRAAEIGETSDMNGYYTWARYGYDAPISNILSPKVQENVAKAFPKAKRISDVMATPEGRAWWKDNGSGFMGEFDLTPGSKSMKVFEAYLKAKGEL